MPLWQVQFSTEAIEELQLVTTYYESLQTGLGIEFMIEFEKQIHQISANPYTRAIRYLEVRFALLHRFPYAIHFVIREKTNAVIVQTVLSTLKNPDEHWKQR